MGSTMTNRKALALALGITAATMIAEIAGGLVSRSLALLADAGHMAADAAALGLSLFAFHLSSRPRTAARTFGWQRFEIFAAFLNGLSLWTIAGFIGYEAVQRLRSPLAVRGGLMLAFAGLGLASNVAALLVLARGRSGSLNIRGAFLHVLGDALGSVGVLAAALLIELTGSFIWDPIVSVVVCALILWSSARLIRESFHVFMEAAPRHLDLGALSEALAGIPGVLEVHDLHVWTITSGFVSLSAHLKTGRGADPPGILREARDRVAARFGIGHATFQIESAEGPACETGTCEGPPDEAHAGRSHLSSHLKA